jgi:hypothetical protein
MAAGRERLPYVVNLAAITDAGAGGEVVPTLDGHVVVMDGQTPGGRELAYASFANIESEAVGGLKLTATGGSAPRSLADRSAEAVNLLDYAGADSSGAAATPLATFSAAFAVAQSLGRAVRIPSGTYRLVDQIAPPLNVPVEFEGVKFTGSGAFYNTGDYSAFFQTLDRAAIKLTNQPGDEFTELTSISIQTTASTSSYEKAAGYDIVETADPSSYTGTAFNKDAVARQMNANILPGNMLGRVWGASTNTYCPAGANGTLCGIEVDITNDSGIDQAAVATPTSKTGFAAVAYGTTPSTSAFAAIGGSTTWHSGFDVVSGAVTDYAFRVLATGSATAASWGVLPTGDAFGPSKTLTPRSTPVKPSSGWTLYTDSADGKLKAIASTGTIISLGTP